jgi:hypothetical protein
MAMIRNENGLSIFSITGMARSRSLKGFRVAREIDHDELYGQIVSKVPPE